MDELDALLREGVGGGAEGGSTSAEGAGSGEPASSTQETQPKAGGAATQQPSAEAQAGQPTQAGQKDEIDALLDQWEQGSDPASDQNRNDPLQGFDPNHPVAKQLLQAAQAQQMQVVKTQVARELKSGGMPEGMIPDFLEFLDGVRTLQENYQQLRDFVGRIDGSPMVREFKANQLAKTYGKYGVTAEDLIRARPQSGQSMEDLAKSLAVLNRKRLVGQRVESRQDSFESGSGGGSTRNSYLDMTVDGLSDITAGLRRR